MNSLWHCYQNIKILHQKKTIGSVTTWMDLEGIMLSEISRERQILYDLSYMWNLKKKKKKKEHPQKRRSDLWSLEAESGGGGTGKGGQKVQTFSIR